MLEDAVEAALVVAMILAGLTEHWFVAGIFLILIPRWNEWRWRRARVKDREAKEAEKS